jgi:ribonuclease HI
MTISEELRQTRSLFTDGSKSAEGSFGGFSVFDHYKDKDWGYRTCKFTLEAMAISEALIRINVIKGRDFSIFSDSRKVTTAISSFKTFRKRSPLISRIKEQL